MGTSSTNSDNTFVIDCTSATTPLNIGNRFKVGWDGSVDCTNLNSLTNCGPSTNVIEISNNFKVDSKGNVNVQYLKSSSGSYTGSHFGSGSFGGLALSGDNISKLSFNPVHYFLKNEGSEASTITACKINGSAYVDVPGIKITHNLKVKDDGTLTGSISVSKDTTNIW
jgi:hypothetical protein